MKASTEVLVLPDYVRTVAPLTEEDGGGWLAWLTQFGTGLSGTGDTPDEALESLDQFLELWKEMLIEKGEDPPAAEPPVFGDELPSGRLNLRLPRTLHRDLAELAEQDGVSLNQLIVSMLSQKRGARTLPGELPEPLREAITAAVTAAITAAQAAPPPAATGESKATAEAAAPAAGSETPVAETEAPADVVG